MKKRSILTIIFLALTLQMGWAQDTTVPAPAASSQAAPAQDSGQPLPAEQSNQGGPVPAFGADTTLPSATENPPISGLDRPSLEPGIVTRSFLSPGLIVSESADSNLVGATGSSQGVGGATRALGSLTLQEVRSRFETDVQYLGGGVFYEGINHDANQIQQLELAQRVTWRTGQLAFRDSFSYLPEGTFGYGAYGGLEAFRSGLAGVGAAVGTLSPGLGTSAGGLFSADQFGSLGQQSRLTNSAVADVVQNLNPRTAITFAGSYGLVRFNGGDFNLVDSNQISAQAGFDRQLSRTDQVALTYGYQDFHYPQVTSSTFTTNIVHFVYGHRVTGRMNFVIGAGPQITNVQSAVLGSTTRITASGTLTLHYRFPRSELVVEYRHYNTNGSGFFLGAKTDVATLSASRSLGRVWEGSGDFGYSDNRRIQSSTLVIPATSYQYFFVSGAVHRHIGRQYRVFLSYQYNRLLFNNSICSSAGDCGKSSNRQTGSVGLEWYPRPFRID